jgi:MoxR-like ATPase
MPDETMTTGGAGTTNVELPADVEEIRRAYQTLRDEIHKVVVGQDEVVTQMLMAIFCRGHAVVVGVPGLAKTLLISTIARSLNLQFSRVQFTPDLMPSDITGTEVIQEDKASGQRELRFVKGPIFANMILADEINRTPPKTQAALLEAMQERQVTIGGRRYELPNPFFVLATQNPIEQEGTYPLPEAQLDRFMFMINITYPSFTEEMEIVRRKSLRSVESVTPVLDAGAIARIQQYVRSMPVADHVLTYALRLVRATRVKEPMELGHTRPKKVQQYVSWGAGPRASEFLVLAAKACALLEGSTHVTPEHVKKIAKPVLRHRVMLNFNAEADQVPTDAIVDDLLAGVSVEDLTPTQKKKMDEVMR